MSANDPAKRTLPKVKGRREATRSRSLLPPQEAGIKPSKPEIGTLFLVPTPIGNPEDISLRALRVLKEADAIVAEDPRVTSELLRRHRLETPLLRLGGPGASLPEVMLLLNEGRQIALVCDAGTPGIADPGTALVQMALKADRQVESLPGPTAVIVALTASGLSTQRFAFDGFPPRARSDRAAFFAALAGEQRTLILFESAAYLSSTLTALRDHLSASRHLAICLDLTTPRAMVWRGTLAEAVREFQISHKRGRYTLTIQGVARSAPE